LREQLKKGGKVYFGSVSEPSVHSPWLHFFLPMVRQNIMAAGICSRGYSPHGGQKAERGDRAEGVGDKMHLSKVHPSLKKK
jgi:hypothetical protein